MVIDLQIEYRFLVIIFYTNPMLPFGALLKKILSEPHRTTPELRAMCFANSIFIQIHLIVV